MAIRRRRRHSRTRMAYQVGVVEDEGQDTESERSTVLIRSDVKYVHF